MGLRQYKIYLRHAAHHKALVECSDIGKRMLGQQARRLRTMGFIKLVDRLATQLFGGAAITLEQYKDIEAKCMDAAKRVADDWHELKGPCKVWFLGISLEASRDTPTQELTWAWYVSDLSPCAPPPTRP